MANQRKTRSQSQDRVTASARFRYESLEGRIAPGSMVDIAGFTGMGLVDQGGESHSSLSDRTGASQSLSTSTGKSFSSTSAGDLFAFKSLIENGDNTTYSLIKSRVEITASVDASRRVQVRGVTPAWSKETFSKALGAAGSTISSFGVSTGRDADPTRSFKGAGKSLGTDSTTQPGIPLTTSGSVGIVAPERGAADLNSLRFVAQTNLDASSDYLLAAGQQYKDLAGVFQTNFLSDDQHRLPAELRGRHDAEIAKQSLDPFSLGGTVGMREPTTGYVQSQPEYDPMRGVLFSYAQFSTVVTDMVKELTEDPNTDDIAYVVVTSETQRTSATNSFINAGANMSRVQFFIQPMNSVWIRDYGPHFITVDDSLAIVDSHYYPQRPSDNFIPTLVGDNNFRVPTYDMGVYFSGGNFQPGPNRSGFVTALIDRDNPAGDGFNPQFLAELHQRYLGIDTLHVLPQLPSSVDGTGHIDMWMYLVDQDTVVISEFLPGSNSTAIQITNNAVGYMESLGFTVHRTPAWNSGSTHFTYANAFRVNDRIFVPVYGTSYKPGGNSAYNSRDDQAMQAWQAAAGPGVEIIPIQCSQIIPSAGAIHCIVKQVPRYTGTSPAVSIVSPAGGEILTPNVPFKLEWSAMDTNNVDPAQIEIHISYGPNQRYRYIDTVADTGSYIWTPNDRIVDTEGATFMVVARSSTGNITEAISEPFAISSGGVVKYDFASGAGANKFAYGNQTASWTTVNGNSLPVTAQLSSTDYGRLATSNATGGTGDTNRYISATPSPSSNESTHVFTFQLASPISRMAQLDVLWEGYANFCTQVELYVWDRIAQNWGNGAGLVGVNRYMDSWAGNIDGNLTGAIRTDFSRYVDPNGVIRFMVYADRPGAVGSAGSGIATYHDYMSVTVKEVAGRSA